MKRRICYGLVLATAGGLTAGCLPEVAVAAAGLRDPAGWLAAAGPDTMAGTVAAATLGLVAAWTSLWLVVALGAALPGAIGRLAGRAVRLALPEALSRVALGAGGLGAGLGVALAPVAALAAPPLPSPTLPVTVAAPAARGGALPAALLPTSPVPPSPAPRVTATVTVRPGDSLWRIAAAHLPRGASEARVAAAWPHWYDANRAVIGADPSRLLPGEVLRVPGGAA